MKRGLKVQLSRKLSRSLGSKEEMFSELSLNDLFEEACTLNSLGVAFQYLYRIEKPRPRGGSGSGNLLSLSSFMKKTATDVDEFVACMERFIVLVDKIRTQRWPGAG